ncbi:MAG TPA: hypothetical protein VM912_23005 [Terriglobales bacterium]|nr:hypothetical protein [Terriglobales bacterium]
MPTLHELEKRADQHRQEALKKIDALAQEPNQQGDEARGSDDSSAREPVEKIVIRRSW